MTTYRYRAVEYRQVSTDKPLLLFSAPCHEVTCWAGIPRKEAKEGVQTVGFQRVKDQKRIRKLEHFLNEKNNVIANPILCAVRNGARVRFEPLGGDDTTQERVGWLVIEEPDYDSYSLLRLFKEVESLLLQRLPRLADIAISAEEISDLRREAQDLPALQDESVDQASNTSKDDGENAQEEGSDEDEAAAAAAFSSETHLEDFFRAVRLRRCALENTAAPDREQLVGFSKETLKDYLRAATVVDGQHRLLGAQQLLERQVDSVAGRNMQDQYLAASKSPEESILLTRQHFSRRLGVALINNDDWAEHVFQFVVVNQKATPIPRALLGSIVATTLTDAEVQRITDRLGKADIDVMDYRTIAYLEGSPESPFRGLIKRGYDEKDSEKKLDWSVMDRLVKTFRYLRGGALFHQPNIDHASNWQRKALEKSGIVKSFSERGYDSVYEYWKSPNGPWRDVFFAVWSEVQSHFAAPLEDRNAPNVWGYPKDSNIFNGIHLSILAADFFAFLSGGPGFPIDSPEATHRLAKEWLGESNQAYFARDWGLKGKSVKKTDAAVKVRWSKLWYEYRENGYLRLPRVDQYRP